MAFPFLLVFALIWFLSLFLSQRFPWNVSWEFHSQYSIRPTWSLPNPFTHHLLPMGSKAENPDIKITSPPFRLSDEHSRVILQPGKAGSARTKVSRKASSGSISVSDYINANFIDGIDRTHAYIATQGPQKTSMGLFWQMVWEQKVKVLVMMTNLVEAGQVSYSMNSPIFKV